MAGDARPPSGFFSTWPAYRPLTDRSAWWQAFTEARRRPVRTMKLAADRRERIVDAAVEVMRTAESPFNVEGGWVAGVRQALCLGGWPWAEADDEARSLTLEALARCGCEHRPDWDQGQRLVDCFNPYSRTRCALCGEPLPDERQTGSVYCGERCRMVSKQRRDRARHSQLLRVEAVARQTVQRPAGAAAMLDCEHCGGAFDARHQWRRMRYCSKRCHDASQVGLRTVPVRPCVRCGTPFRPERDKGKYCSPACYRTRGESEHRGIETQCPVCAVVFRYHSPTQPRVCCSRRCAWVLRRRGEREATQPTPAPAKPADEADGRSAAVRVT